MNCGKCGTELPEGSLFCPECGEKVAVESESTAAEATTIGSAAPRPKNRKRRRIVLVCVGVVLALLIALGSVLTVRYQAAWTLFNQGNYAWAKEDFEKLGIFWNSREMVRESSYQQARHLIGTKDYDHASSMFAQLGDYKDSPEKLAECENYISYTTALRCMENHEIESAKERFAALGSFLDSRQKVEECEKAEQYDAGIELLDAEALEAAKDAFTQAGDYSDAVDQVVLCANKIDYRDAGQAFADGKFYTAYKIYRSLGPYEDALERSEACVQQVPVACELYHNDAHRYSSCYIDLIAPDDGFHSYMKIYAQNGELVSTAFIPSGKKVRIHLLPGAYQFNLAVGVDWFGEQELFGSENATYNSLKFEDGLLLQFKANYKYWIQLRTEGEGNVETQTLDPSDM